MRLTQRQLNALVVVWLVATGVAGLVHWALAFVVFFGVAMVCLEMGIGDRDNIKQE